MMNTSFGLSKYFALSVTTAVTLCLALALQGGDAYAKAKPKDCKKDDARCAEAGVVIGIPTDGGLAIGSPNPSLGRVPGEPRGLQDTPDAIIEKPKHVEMKQAAVPMAALVAQPVISNRGFETVDPAAPTKALNWADFWSGGYTRVSSSPPADSSNPYALRVVVTGRAGAGGQQWIPINQMQVSPIFIGGRVRGSQLIAKPRGGWYWGAHIIAEFYGQTQNDYVYCSTPQAVGTFGWRWIGFTSTNCQVNFPIVGVWIEPVVESATGTAWFDLMQINAADPPSMGAVTFQFDDGVIDSHRPIYEETILSNYGFVGSEVIVSDWVVDTDPTVLTKLDLQRMQSKGWDVLSHSKNHPYMTQLSDDQAIRQLNDSKTALQNKGLTIDSFGWPYGDYNQKLVGFAQATPYVSSRGYFDGDNPILTFPHDVRVHSLTYTLEKATKPTGLDQVKTWLKQAADTKRWAILGMHVIAPTGDDVYRNTPGFLDQVAAMVKTEFVNTGKLQVINYRQGIQTFAVTRQ